MKSGVEGAEPPEQSLVGQRGDDSGLPVVRTALHLEQLAEREVDTVGGSELRVAEDDGLMEREIVDVEDEVVGSKQIRAPRV